MSSYNRNNRKKFLNGDMSLGGYNRDRDRDQRKNGMSPAQQEQQKALQQKKELIRAVGAHMNSCQVCQTYGHNRCRALKELQDRFQ